MNRKELILDFLNYYSKISTFSSAYLMIPTNYINRYVDEYLEMLDAIEDLNDDN